MDGKKDLQNIGQRLKKLRTERGVTLQEVSGSTGLSISFLSLFENGKSGISLANLQKILQLFNSSIHDLIDVAEDERVVKYEEAKAILSDSGDVRILSLVKKARTKKIWAGLFIMEPGSTIGEFQHDGEEFSHIIQGKAEVTLKDPESGKIEKYILTEGDTIYHPSSFLHTYVNLSKQKTIFLAAVTPPTF
ncbi:MAG: helix-turn-helix domain-containing protein [Syntrophales bacterium]